MAWKLSEIHNPKLRAQIRAQIETQPARIHTSKLECPAQQPFQETYEDEKRSRASLIVVITRCSSRLLDVDNLYGANKGICDALRYAKIIPEDNPETIDLQCRQIKTKDKSQHGTKIEIYEKQV